MFFGLAPQRAVLSDINADLINAYAMVRDEPSRVKDLVSSYPIDRSFYYSLRAQHDLTGINAAAKFIYLNRTCYGGMHRTNRKGEFNVPFGGGSRTPARMLAECVIEKVSAVLGPQVALASRGFEEAFEHIREGRNDVIYCDPTYHSAGRTQFDRYGKDVFGWEQQVRLADLAERACHVKRATVVISNADDPDIRSLYSARGFNAYSLVRKKTIGNAAGKSAVHDEVLFVFDPSNSTEWFRVFGNPAACNFKDSTASFQAA